jgi:hypothetical protein
MTQHWNLMRFNITDDLHGNPQVRVGNPWKGWWGHMGALAASPSGLVVVPLERDTGVASRAAFGVFDSDLNAKGRYTVPKPPAGAGIPDEQWGGENCSWAGYNPKNGKFYSSAYTAPGWIYAYNISASGASFDSAFQIRDANGNAIQLHNVQGGSFSDSGKLYLITTDPGQLITIDTSNGRVQDVFPIEEHPGFPEYEELEAVMVWDTTGRAPNGWSGQVHVLLLDNDVDEDDFTVKHYTAFGSY